MKQNIVPKEFSIPLTQNEMQKLKWLETHGYENCENACIMRTRYTYGNQKKPLGKNYVWSK